MADHKFGINLDGKELGIKFDDSKVKDAMNDARDALGLQAWGKPKENHELRNAAIAGAAGFATGAGLTAAGEIGIVKAAEPVMRPLVAVGMSMLGGGNAYSAIMNGPKLRALECLTPKPILVGGAIVAGLAVGGYELYEHVFKREK